MTITVIDGRCCGLLLTHPVNLHAVIKTIEILHRPLCALSCRGANKLVPSIVLNSFDTSTGGSSKRIEMFLQQLELYIFV